ncbi:N-acylneuraminate-9-phosphatase [Lampris incognitus]|uniref:N-acylneuraminate-9-phosphatase n=1 Tax=Lampris incognitus TaxID=2546036 RepID=UPI0024B593A0|nr:N-acylneuraminate-9-phosphatase [Lampris incognitus]
MDRKPVRAILFDLDNTLIETNRAGGVAIQKTCELLKKTLGLDEGTVFRVCDAYKDKLRDEVFDASGARSIDEVRVGHWEESIQEVVAGSPEPSLATDCYYLWKNTRLQLLSLSPDIRNLLRELRTGYKLLLLTNGETRTQREKVEVVGCEEFFDAVVVGGEHPEQKPSPSIFTHCFALLGVEAQDCVMVGDSLGTDIKGGLNAGVRATVWINQGGSLPDDSIKPDFTIPSVLGLPDVLESLK